MQLANLGENKDVTIKPLVLSTTAFLVGSFGTSLAQVSSPITETAPALPAAISAAAHDALTHGGKIGNGSKMVSAASTDRVAAAAIAPAFTLGWNVVHASHCLTYYSGVYTWLYIYPSEGGIFYTNNLSLQAALHPQCSLGNYVAFYVVDSSGYWNQIYSYDYK